jgi:nanoRNase/pAp phosphatase (c-di-AMP/oligoRNAs hydrolase)
LTTVDENVTVSDDAMEEVQRFDPAPAIDALKRRLNGGKMLILTHDNPDPDSLAGALGLERLLADAGIPSLIGVAGIIGRAENRAMVRELSIELEPLQTLDFAKFAGVALVDTQPGTGNNSLPAGRIADIVIDHHPPRPASAAVPWCDIRPELGATATIAFEYLKRSRIKLDPPLATAFFYAIKSETRDLGREAGPAERAAYIELAAQADFELLHAITNPKLSREHYVAVDRALRAAVRHGTLITVNLGKLDYPDLVAEVADLLLPYERVRWVMCVGRYKKSAFLSLRTDDLTANAGQLIRRVVGTEGASGGHDMTAGGRMFREVTDDDDLKEIYDGLVKRMLAELAITAEPSTIL